MDQIRDSNYINSRPLSESSSTESAIRRYNQTRSSPSDEALSEKKESLSSESNFPCYMYIILCHCCSIKKIKPINCFIFSLFTDKINILRNSDSFFFNDNTDWGWKISPYCFLKLSFYFTWPLGKLAAFHLFESDLQLKTYHIYTEYLYLKFQDMINVFTWPMFKKKNNSAQYFCRLLCSDILSYKC